MCWKVQLFQEEDMVFIEPSRVGIFALPQIIIELLYAGLGRVLDRI